MISAPISFAVSHVFTSLEKKDFEEIAKTLKFHFWSKESIIPHMSIIDTTIHSLAYSNSEELKNFRDIIMPTQILKAAWGEYDSKHWSRSENLAKRVLKLDSTSYSARKVLFKSLVRQRRWPVAEEVLVEIYSADQIDRFSLRGFMECRRGHHERAIDLFKQGHDAGDRTNSLYREWAYSEYVLGRPKDAKDTIDKAL